jgi:hypothetical protein
VSEVKGVRSFTPSLRTSITDIAVLLALFLATIAVSSTATTSTFARADPIPGTGAIGPPLLSIVTGASTLDDGTSASLDAVWSPAGPGCANVPFGYQWSTPAGSSRGLVLPTAGPQVNFTALADASGPTVVTVRSTDLVNCATSARILTESATRSLTTVSPLEIEDFEIEPNPVLPGTPTNLSLTLADGVPPYHLDVTWGDGNSSLLTVTSAGSVEVAHRFASGRFSPTVIVSDDAGSMVRVSAAEAVNVSGGIAAAIHLGEPGLEAGLPAEVSGIVTGPVLPTVNWTQCSEAWGAGGRATPRFTSNATCDFLSPGTATITYLATYHNSTVVGVVMTALSAPVVPALSIAVTPDQTAVQCNASAALILDVKGGVPPVRLAWTEDGNSTDASTWAYSDGLEAITVAPATSGTFLFRVWGTDADGAEANASQLLTVLPDPSGTVATSRVANASGATMSLVANITGGRPPYTWWVVSDLIGHTGNFSDGTLAGAGSFGWNVSLRAEGVLPIWVVVFDSAGASWSWARPLPLVPALGASLSGRVVANTSGEWLLLTGAIQGGEPPFNLTAFFGTNQSWSAPVSSDGRVSFNVSTNQTGSTVVIFRVEDAWENNWTASEFLTFPTASNSSSPPPPAERTPGGAQRAASGLSWAVGIGFLLGLVAVVVLVRTHSKRRSATPPPPPPDPVAVVRAIVEPAEGAERATVELLAEDSGVPYAEARATIDRLIADGTLRSETGPDGVEILAWSEPT